MGIQASGEIGRRSLNQRIERHLCPAVPADDKSQRHSQNHAQDEAPGDAKQRRHHILKQQPVLQQVADSNDHFPRGGQEMNGVPGDGNLPQNKQDCDERDGAKTDDQVFRPLSSSRSVESNVSIVSIAIGW